MTPNRENLQNLYDAFNARDIEAVLAAMQPEVQWANGMEGGFVYGCEAVRDYWIRQFAQFQPHLAILHFETEDPQRALVTVHQAVRDLEGNLLFEGELQHRFTFKDGLVARFEIVGAKAAWEDSVSVLEPEN